MKVMYTSEEYDGHKDCVYALANSSSKNIFYTGGMDGMLVKWNLETPGKGELIMTTPSPIYSIMELSSVLILAGASDGKLYVADLLQKKPRVIEAHKKGIFQLIDWGPSILSCGGDGFLKKWHKQDLLPEWSIAVSSESIRCMEKDMETLFMGASDNCIYKFSNQSKEKPTISKWQAHDNSVFSLALDKENGRLFSGGRDAKIKVWNSEGLMLKEVNAHWYHVNDLAINPLRNVMASCSLDKSIRLWEMSEMRLLKNIAAPKEGSHTNSVNRLLWLNSEKLVSVGDDRKVIVHHFQFEDN